MSPENTVPIRRLTLYKHGVGFVEREGAVEGAELRLTFGADEVNDALKSLLVIDRQGGAVLGMDYVTPGRERERAGDTFADVSDERSLRDLLRALRGWSVRLILGDDAASVTGRVLGIDVAQPETMLSHTVVALLDEEGGESGVGAVRTVPVTIVRRVVLLDERANRDLRALLDDSRGEDTRREVVVRLTPGAHDLTVSYLVPSPTWRVSYRVVVESARNVQQGGQDVGVATDATDATDTEGGTVLLQGWGLFDNRLEEDLDGVSVTLVAGQPISFVYDLASSRIPERPVVQDEARVVAAPVQFDAMAMAMVVGAAETPAPRGRAARAQAEGSVMAAAPAPMARKVATIESLAAQPVAAAGGGLGELFQYEVTTPVTVKRGASALVPILSATMPCRRELLYNRDKLAGHPVAALRFTNSSGLVLERGPATVVDDGAYHGEAIVSFIKDDGEVYLAYAVELGVTITMSSEASVETAGLAIGNGLLHLKSATVTRTTYRLESNLNTERRVTIEHPKGYGSDLVETRAPDARSGELYRWDVPCPARRAIVFVVAERRFNWSSHGLLDYSYARLQEYLAQRWLDEATMSRLDALFAERAAIGRNDEEVKGLQAERTELYERQESLRANMTALGAEGEEGALRVRAVRDLAASEDRLQAIGARLDALKEDNARRQATIDGYLATLEVGDQTASE